MHFWKCTHYYTTWMLTPHGTILANDGYLSLYWTLFSRLDNIPTYISIYIYTNTNHIEPKVGLIHYKSFWWACTAWPNKSNIVCMYTHFTLLWLLVICTLYITWHWMIVITDHLKSVTKKTNNELSGWSMCLMTRIQDFRRSWILWKKTSKYRQVATVQSDKTLFFVSLKYRNLTWKLWYTMKVRQSVPSTKNTPPPKRIIDTRHTYGMIVFISDIDNHSNKRSWIWTWRYNQFSINELVKHT